MKMKMPLVLHCFEVLLLFLLLSSLERQGCEARRVKNCCLRTTDNKVRLEALKKYNVQKKPLCPKNALIFTTENSVICSDPSSPWAIRAKEYLDKKKKESMRTSHQTTTFTPEVQTNSTSTNGTLIRV